MPRDGLQQYSPPPGTQGIPNFTVESGRYNAFVADVTADLNLPRPIVAGGTGASSADGALDNLSAEKFKQVVTNWDSNVWRAGSFYAAATASGTAPVAGHAFAGIVYYANATDLVCEATDLTDPLNPDKYIRVMVAGVWSAWVRTGANASFANLGEYIFDSGVTFPPGVGQIRFNNAAQNTATELFISHLGALGSTDNTGLLTFFLRSGSDVIVQDKDEGAKYKVFTTTADPVLSGSDFRVTAVFKSGGTDIVSGQRVLAGASIGGAVLYNTPQTLTAPQRTQARQNIYAAPFDAMAYNGLQVNGDFIVNQERGVGVPITASGYVSDMWWFTKIGTMAVSAVTASTSVTKPPNISNWFIAQVTTAQATMTGSDAVHVYQSAIEGYRMARVNWGVADGSAQPITIGFWSCHYRTGIYTGSVRSIGNARSYVFSYTHAAADTKQWNVITIPPDTAGTWDKTNGVGLTVGFCVAAGPTLTAPALNTWYGASYVAGPGQVNGVASTADVFRITGLIVLPGLEAPNAERSHYIMRPYDQELLTCQRHFRWLPFNLYFAAAAAGNFSGHTLSFSPMRAAPTVGTTVPDPSATQTTVNNAANLINTITPSSAMVLGGATAAGIYQVSGYRCSADARL